MKILLLSFCFLLIHVADVRILVSLLSCFIMPLVVLLLSLCFPLMDVCSSWAAVPLIHDQFAGWLIRVWGINLNPCMWGQGSLHVSIVLCLFVYRWLQRDFWIATDMQLFFLLSTFFLWELIGLEGPWRCHENVLCTASDHCPCLGSLVPLRCFHYLIQGPGVALCIYSALLLTALPLLVMLRSVHPWPQSHVFAFHLTCASLYVHAL